MFYELWVQNGRLNCIFLSTVVSGCELFSRFITLGKFDDKPMDECMKIMVQRGDVFLERLLGCRSIIATHFTPFVTDNCVSFHQKKSKNYS